MIPNPPLTTLAPLGRWLENLRTHVNRQKIIKGSGYGIKEHTNGVELILPQSGGGSGVSIKRFWVVANYRKYLSAVPYALRSGYDQDDIISIGKPLNLQLYDVGITGNYRYIESGHRYYRVAASVADGFLEIEESVKPDYQINNAGASIMAYQPQGGVPTHGENVSSEAILLDHNNEEVTWLDANEEGRNWFPEYNVYTVCINKVLHKAIFSAGESEAVVS